MEYLFGLSLRQRAALAKTQAGHPKGLTKVCFHLGFSLVLEVVVVAVVVVKVVVVVVAVMVVVVVVVLVVVAVITCNSLINE